MAFPGNTLFQQTKQVGCYLDMNNFVYLESWGKDLLERYELLYSQAVANRNLKAATKILENMANLKGLLTQKVEVKSDNNVELNWNVGDNE